MRNSFLLILLLILLGSCEFSDNTDVRYSMGNDFLNDPARVIMVDTLTLKTYTIMSDSVITSYGTRLLAGRIKDEYGIESYAEGYFMIDQPTKVPSSFYESAQYDSAHIVLKYDGYSIGDTTKLTKFGIYELAEVIDPEATNENNLYMYNFQKLAHKETPICTFDAYELEKGDSMVVKLDDVYGKMLYDLVYNDDSILDTEEYETFLDVFKGFVVRPITEEPSFIMGIISNPDSTYSPSIHVFYHDKTESDVLSFNYPMRKYNNLNQIAEEYKNKYAYNYIATSLNGTPLEGMQSGTYRLASSETNEITYLQGGGTNMKTLITIPYVSNLRSMGIGAVIGAELTFYPVKENYNGFFNLPTSLEFNLVDSKNTVLGLLPGIDGSAIYSKLYYSKNFPDETRYTFDITQFVKDKYNTVNEIYESGLALKINSSSLSNSVSGLAIGSPKHAQAMKLKVYLTKY